MIDPGIYAIYAEPEPRDSANLAQHAVVGVVFAMPTVTAEARPALVAPGDPLGISGAAMGSPENVYIWIFGPNFHAFRTHPASPWHRERRRSGRGALNSTGSFEIGGSPLGGADEYTVTAESASADVSRSAAFRAVKSIGPIPGAMPLDLSPGQNCVQVLE